MTHAQIDFLILVQAWLDGSPQTEDKLVEVLMPNRKLLVGGRVVSVYSSVAPSLDVMCRISLRRSNPPSMILELQKSVADINCESVLHFFEQTHGVRIAEVAQEGDPIIEALSDASGRRVHFCFSSAQKSHERMLRWLTCIRPAASLA